MSDVARPPTAAKPKRIGISEVRTPFDSWKIAVALMIATSARRWLLIQLSISDNST